MPPPTANPTLVLEAPNGAVMEVGESPTEVLVGKPLNEVLPEISTRPFAGAADRGEYREAARLVGRK
jgi:hypothetical protein